MNHLEINVQIFGEFKFWQSVWLLYSLSLNLMKSKLWTLVPSLIKTELYGQPIKQLHRILVWVLRIPLHMKWVTHSAFCMMATATTVGVIPEVSWPLCFGVLARVSFNGLHAHEAEWKHFWNRTKRGVCTKHKMKVKHHKMATLSKPDHLRKWSLNEAKPN